MIFGFLACGPKQLVIGLRTNILVELQVLDAIWRRTYVFALLDVQLKFQSMFEGRAGFVADVVLGHRVVTMMKGLVGFCHVALVERRQI